MQKYTGASRPSLDKLGGTTWEKAKTRVKKAMRDMAEELLKLYAARKAVPGPRLQPRLALAAGVRGRLRVGADRRPDRPPSPTSSATWSRRRTMDRLLCGDVGLRQDRSRDARGLQGGHGRQAGRVPRADDGARVPAPEDAEGSLRRVPGPHRHGQPLPHQGGTEADARGSEGRQGRDHRRHAPPALEGRRSSGISACWSSTRSSASASRTRNASSRCASASTC